MLIVRSQSKAVAGWLVAAGIALATPLPTVAQSELVWSDAVEVAQGEAFRGPWRMNDSDFRYVDDPSIHLSETGYAGVVWVDQEEQEVFFQLFDSDLAESGDAINVSNTPGIFSWLPRVLMVTKEDAPEEVHVLWQEIVFSGGSHGGEIFYARSMNGGQTFEPALNLSNSPNGAGKGRLSERYWHNGSLDLARSDQGTLFAAWTDYEGELWVSRSTDDGESFTEPLHVAGDHSTPARGPSLVVGPGEELHLAWTVGETSSADIHYATSRDGGRSFSDPQVVDQSPGHADAPVLALDHGGNLYLAYAYSESGPFRPATLRFVRRPVDGEGFESPREVATGLPRPWTSAGFPGMDLDAEGRIYLLMELFEQAGGRSNALGWMVSTDHGESFSELTTVGETPDRDLGVNGSQQGLFMRKLSVNPAGEVALINSTFRDNDQSRVRWFRGVWPD